METDEARGGEMKTVMGMEALWGGVPWSKAVTVNVSVSGASSSEARVVSCPLLLPTKKSPSALPVCVDQGVVGLISRKSLL